MAILTGVRWYLMVVLIYISLTGMLSIFSSACWPFVYLPWRRVYSGFFFFFFFFFLSFVVVVAISWAAPAAYGGSQARGRIGAVATSLSQSHSNAESEPRLRPTPQLTATPDRQPTEQGQGPNLQPPGS